MYFSFQILFAMVPLAELWLLVWMTQRTSLGWTILLVISTGMIRPICGRVTSLNCLTKAAMFTP